MDQLNIDEILKYLPHRYPFLLLDRILDCEKGVHLRALKNVSYNEPFFQGHFPIKPIFPGVLLIEAMAQATAVLSFRSLGGYPARGEIYLLAGVDNARFKQQVGPGDQVIFDVSIVKGKRGIWRYTGEATVDGKLVFSADLMGALKQVDI